MSEETMLILIGVCVVLYAIRLSAAIWQARTTQRMAEAMEDRMLMDEIRLIDSEECAEAQPVSPVQEYNRAKAEEEKRSLLVRKGADKIGRRRAEAGF